MTTYLRDNNIKILFFIWLLPCISFIISPSYDTNYFLVLFPFIFTILLALFDKKNLIFAIPFVALLSPLIGGNNPLPALPSEIFAFFLFLIVFFFIVFTKSKSFPLYKGDHFLVGVLLTILISLFASFEAFRLFKSLVNWIIIFIIFVSTRLLIEDHKDILKVFDSFISASILSSCLILAAYFSGISLSSFVNDQGNKDIVDINTINYAFRGSFFYANIGYVLGLSLLISIVKFFYSNSSSKKIFYFLSVLFIFLTIFVLVEKTSLMALVISILTLSFVYLYFHSKNFSISIFFLSFFSLIVFQITVYLFSYFNLDFQLGGFEQRLCVFNSAINVMIDNPISLLFGFGPDSTNILSDNPNIRNSLVNCANSHEGAIDSGLVTYFFEYGIFFITFLYIFFISTLFGILKKLKFNPDKNGLTLILLISIVFINISMLGDVLGTSKITWIIAQIIALYGMLLTKEKLSEQRHIKFYK